MNRILPIVAGLAMMIQAAFASDPAAAKSKTSSKRVVIDVQNPNAARMLHNASRPNTVSSVTNAAGAYDAGDRGLQLPWDSNIVLHSSSGEDSFLVSSSRSGCPGTKVRPSVAVAFATSRGWSDPPIRFGPLSLKGICPLGKGMELEVRSVGGSAPYVRLVERARVLSKQ